MILTSSLKRTTWLASFVAIVASIVLLTGVSAHAQANTSQNITMSPASTLLSIKPGDSVQKSFQIMNSGGDTFRVATSVSPYYVTGLEYTPQFNQLPGTTQTSSWIKILNPNTTVAPQESTTINYTVAVPAGTAPGGYYAVLFAETQPVNGNEQTGVVPRNRVGNILYITVEGPVTMSGDVKVEHLGSFRYQPTVPLGAVVSNTGGIHFQTTVRTSVKSITGKQIYSATIERYVLPQTERKIVIDWSPTSPIGIYTVSRSANVAGTERTLPDERFIYIQPWVIVVIVALTLSVVLFFLTRASARRKNPPAKQVKK
jgi:hypothetical protein